MRIHFVNNTCNNNYVNAKFLRALGVDAHLFLGPNFDWQTNPAAEDPEIGGRFPDWIHSHNFAEIGPCPWTDPSPAFIQKLGQCDVLHVQDIGVVWAAMTDRPFVWHPYGWDFYNLPFYEHWRDNSPSDPTTLLHALLMRRAMSEAESIIIELWGACWEKGMSLIDCLGLSARINHSIPIIFDTNKFCPGPKKSLLELVGTLPRHSRENDLFLFHPTRQMLSRDPVYYGNDILYRALGQLQNQGLRFTLAVVEKGIPDEMVAKELIRQAGIEDRVVWVPAMPRHRLIDWYRSADITITELFDGFGSAANEAMACGCPLVCNLITDSNRPTFWKPPISPPLINVSTEADVVHALRYYAERRGELVELGKAGRRWVEEHRSGKVVAEKLVNLYQHILDSTGKRRAPLGLTFARGLADVKSQKLWNAIGRLFDAADENPSGIKKREQDLLAACQQLAYELALERGRNRQLHSLKFLAKRFLLELFSGKHRVLHRLTRRTQTPSQTESFQSNPLMLPWREIFQIVRLRRSRSSPSA